MTPTRAVAEYHPWTTALYARDEARRRGDRKIGTEHLVLGLLREPAVVGALGLDLEQARARLEALDRDALAAVGVAGALDAPAVTVREQAFPPRPTLAAVLRDHMPMTPGAKAALREGSRDMRRGRRITAPQIMLALLQLAPPDPAAELIDALGVDRGAARAQLAAA